MKERQIQLELKLEVQKRVRRKGWVSGTVRRTRSQPRDAPPDDFWARRRGVVTWSWWGDIEAPGYGAWSCVACGIVWVYRTTADAVRNRLARHLPASLHTASAWAGCWRWAEPSFWAARQRRRKALASHQKNSRSAP
eukprot:CAMPEP_0184722990 /NCGR_PEP_ID=MMETSP0314-20130426/23808_1 /TAXON_ID=38298 /ORGANISM="Rhodella maculata, Strain CCMP 736" /LENGTH=136 /DNA_ID=CAMNT_0027187695 /DNA_START=1 /DNA_END=408 /DNA_ORIENTATION=+